MRHFTDKFLFSIFLLLPLGYLNAQEGIEQEDFSPRVQSVLLEDMRLASYGELVIWLQDLNLPIRGTRGELIVRLQDYYGFSDEIVVAEPPPDERDGGGIEVIIDAADSVNFFTIEDISEDYVRIGGGVRLSLVEGNTHHRISADQLILNRKENLLTTMGEVAYTIILDGEEIQEFKGESLSLDVQSWEGIFLGGVTVVEQTIDDKPVEMFFQGESVFRGTRNLVVFDNARIFTSRRVDPYFSIRAQKLWFLAPEEWATFNAVVEVGRVPLLYLPFFFQPGDRLFFQPTLGFHSLYGTYVQTTTYIWGESPRSTSSFSVLQVSAAVGKGVERDIKGAFLRPVENPQNNRNKEDLLWKVMLDGYMKKGIYLATQGDMTGLANLSPFTFRLGIAFTRMLFDLGTSEQNFVIHEGRLTDYWDSSYLFTLRLPLRYELQLGLGWTGKGLSVGFSGEMFSDRYMKKDFYQRSESFSWDFALGRTLTPPDNPSLPISSNWQFRSSYTPSFDGDLWKEVSRYLQIRLTLFNLNLQLQSKNVATNRLPTIARRSDILDNTQVHFFYPYHLIIPDLRVSLSGLLVDYTMGTNEAISPESERAEAVDDTIFPPWTEEEHTLFDEGSNSPLQLPDLQSTSYNFSERAPVQFSLSYVITPSLLIDQYTNAQNWVHPSDIEKGSFFRFTKLENSERIQLNHTLRVFGGIGEITGSSISQLAFAKLLSYDEASYTDTELTSLLQTIHQKESQNLEIQNTLKIFPFRYLPLVSKSNANYDTRFLLVNRTFTRMKGQSPLFDVETFEFTDEFVRKHTMGFSLIFDVWDKDQEFSFLSTLPPHKRTELTPSLHLRFWLFEFSAKTKILTPEKIPSYDPIDFDFRFVWNPYITFSQLFRIDPEEQGELINSNSSFKGKIVKDILVLSVDAIMRKQKGVFFDLGTSSWKNTNIEILRLEKIASSLALNYPLPPFWKNRINLTLESSLGISFDFLQFTASALTFSYGLKFSVFKSVSIRFQALMENKALHLYFPSYTEQLGIATRDFFVDLGRSLNIASNKDLKESQFNLKSIKLDFMQEFPDWILMLSYEGGPELTTGENGVQRYEWGNRVTFSVSWGLLKILSAKGGLEDDEFSFNGNQQ